MSMQNYICPIVEPNVIIEKATVVAAHYGGPIMDSVLTAMGLGEESSPERRKFPTQRTHPLQTCRL